MTVALLDDAACLTATAGVRYGLAYGSHASSNGSHHSDLDLLFLTHRRFTPDRAAELEHAVIDLHHRYTLRLDTEVAYSVKLTATAEDVRRAVALASFTSAANGRLTVPPIRDLAYLNSDPFKWRLLLNALSTPHVFLGGDVRLFDQHRAAAARATAALALHLLPAGPVTVAEAVAVLMTGPGGVRHKDHLGYTDEASLVCVLRQGFERLRVARVVETPDGRTWRPVGPEAAATPLNRRLRH